MIRLSNFQTVVIFGFIALIGYLLIPRLSVQYQSSGSKRFYNINYTANGYTDDFLEQQVTSIIEAALMGIEGIAHLSSLTTEFGGSIDIELDKKANADFIRFEIGTTLRYLYEAFPSRVSFPKLSISDAKQTVLEQPLIVYSISGPNTVQELKELCDETIIPYLSSLPDIESVVPSGFRRKVIKIHFNTVLLNSLGLVPKDIMRQIKRRVNRQHLGISSLKDKHKINTILIEGLEMPTSDEQYMNFLEEMTITNGTSFFQIKDIARLVVSEENVKKYYRINGQNALTLRLYPRPRANQIRTAQEVKQKIAALIPTIESSISIKLERDQTAYLSKELNKIYKRSLLSLIILIIFLMLFYRSWKTVLIVLLSLFINLGLAFGFYAIFKIELNLYSLAAITVTFGLIIDNAIIILHHLRSYANTAISSAIITATLTTLSALLIIVFLPEEIKIDLSYFAYVMIINLIISIVVSRYFVPAMFNILRVKYFNYSKELLQEKKWSRIYKSYILFAKRHRWWLITGIILLFGLPIYLLPGSWEGHPFYNKTIGSDKYNYELRPVINKILGGTSRLFAHHVYDNGTFRKPTETRLYVQCRMPEGSTVAQTNELITYLDQYLISFGNKISSFSTQINNGNTGQISIAFPDENSILFPIILKNKLSTFCSQFGGPEWRVYGVGEAFSNKLNSLEPDFNISIRGYDRQQISALALRTKTLLEKHPRVDYVELDANTNWLNRNRHVFSLVADINKMSHFDLSMSDIDVGLEQFDVTEQSDILHLSLAPLTYSIAIQEQHDLWTMQNTYTNVNDKRARLGDFLSFNKSKKPAPIIKEDQEYLHNLEFKYTGSEKFGQQFSDSIIQIVNKEAPIGYRLEADEKSRIQFSQISKKNYLLLLLIFFSIFIICAIHFESFSYPLRILFLIPTSFIGIFLIFYWTNASFDQGGYTSFILVSGLTVNSMIYLFNDFQKNLMHHQVIDAYLLAFEKKISPILLTIISTSFGLSPFILIGNNDIFWSSLAIGSLGGLLFSIVILVFFVPLLLPKKGPSN